MKTKTPKHKTYTVHKKPAKKAEWKTIGEVLKETPVPSQLDRIERKLDELLARTPYFQPYCIPQNPQPQSPWYYELTRTPRNPDGTPAIWCSANGGAR